MNDDITQCLSQSAKQVNLTTEYKLHKRALQTKFVQFIA